MNKHKVIAEGREIAKRWWMCVWVLMFTYFIDEFNKSDCDISTAKIASKLIT